MRDKKQVVRKEFIAPTLCQALDSITGSIVISRHGPIFKMQWLRDREIQRQKLHERTAVIKREGRNTFRVSASRRKGCLNC